MKKFTLTDIFGNLNEDHLKSNESKIKYILDNQESNIVGYPFIEDDLKVLSDKELDKVYLGLELKTKAKKEVGTVSENDSPQLKRMQQLVKSFSIKDEVIKEDKKKEINQEALSKESERRKKLSSHRIDELDQGGMKYGGGHAETVNTFISPEAHVKKFATLSTPELNVEEALEVAIRRVLRSGTPVNNMSFYDEINWNLNQLGFDSKIPVDIKNALRKVIGGEIDSSIG